jgi:hypothetical protein
MQLTYITPATPEELSGHYEALVFLHAFVPKDYRVDLKGFIEGYAGFVTMVYSGKVPIGCFTLYPVQGTSKKSVEIHGVYRQDLKLLLGRKAAKVLMDHIFSEIFQIVFMEARKEKIVAKVTPAAKMARVWLRKYGFEKVPNTERGKTIWKLERSKYLGVVHV